MFMKNKVTWDKARADCLKRGGDLVIPTSNTECDLLSQRAHTLGMSVPWIGASRYLMSVDGNYRVEIYIHLLVPMTRNFTPNFYDCIVKIT
jgi:hypothetical protein